MKNEKHNIEKKIIMKLKHYEFKDFTEISDKIDEYLSEFTDKTIDLLPEGSDIQSIEFILYEILINVYKHSRFKNAYLKIIISNDGQNIEIIINDDGIGIPKSFEEESMKSTSDCEAIYEAINGKTTDKEKYGLHGRGLNSTARITTLGFDGTMTISSGKGFCKITKNGAKTFPSSNQTTGTLIVIKIQNQKVDNIYEYLKYKTINRIKEDKNDNA